MNYELPISGKPEALERMRALEVFLQSLEKIKRPDVVYEEGKTPIADVNNIRYIAQDTESFEDCRVSRFVLYGDTLQEVIDMTEESLPLLDGKDKVRCNELIRMAKFYLASRDDDAADVLNRIRLVEFTASRIGASKLIDFEKKKMLEKGGYRSLTERERRIIEPVLACYDIPNHIKMEDIYFKESDRKIF